MTIEFGALAVLYNLVEVAPYGADQFVRLAAGRFLVCEAFDRVSELVDEFARQRRVIVDEIERVLDLVRDARRELAEGGQLLRLDEAVLRLAQIVERRGELLRSGLNFVEEPSVLDCDHGLVGESAHHLDLALRERDRIGPGERENAEDLAHAKRTPQSLDPPFAQQRHRQQGAVVADPRPLAEIVFGIGEHIWEMHRFAAQHDSPSEGLASSPDRMRAHELNDLRGAAQFRSEPHRVALAQGQRHKGRAAQVSRQLCKRR